jgi:cysteine desulfurase
VTGRETYLDWNATAPPREEARAAVSRALLLCGNPSSLHRRGRASRRALEEARGSLAALVGASPGSVTFTSGGTEANHLALLGAGRERVLVSAVEHPSVLGAVPGAERVAVDRLGLVRLDALEDLLRADGRPALVSVMLANNETGVIEPAAEVAAIARRYGALFHCDAVQAAGRIALDFAALGADFLSLSAHKIGGPAGVGALVIAEGREVGPLLRGGGQERRRRAGTENLPGIAGFGAAAAAAEIGAYERVRSLREELERELAGRAPDCLVLGAGAPRLPNTVAVAMPGVAAETQVIALDLEGVMVSAGAACSSGKIERSHVLEAMGLPPEISGSTIRVSLGWSTSEGDIDHFLDAWTALYRRRRARREGLAA